MRERLHVDGCVCAFYLKWILELMCPCPGCPSICNYIRPMSFVFMRYKICTKQDAWSCVEAYCRTSKFYPEKAEIHVVFTLDTKPITHMKTRAKMNVFTCILTQTPQSESIHISMHPLQVVLKEILHVTSMGVVKKILQFIFVQQKTCVDWACFLSL